MPPPIFRTASHDMDPDVICGIDFGMTCTGVAYVVRDSSDPAHVPTPETLLHWEGIHSSRLTAKIPTELIYDAAGEVSRWGLGCRESADRSLVKKLFKLDITPSSPDRESYGHTTQEAKDYFADYIHKVYEFVDGFLGANIPGYRAKVTEFVFSVPTTWKVDTVEEIKCLVNGIFTKRNHKAVIGLTEAEAAAVAIIRRNHKTGEVVLVCDAGGGTTDVNLLRLVSSEHEPVRMDRLTFVEGTPLGSTRIDQAAIQYICDTVGDQLGLDIKRIAERMVEGKFQEYKHQFGAPGFLVPKYYFPIPDIDKNFTLTSASVEDSRFVLPVSELRNWFDVQIAGIIELVDSQISRLRAEHKREKISYMIFSGGFGTNEYVRKRLKEHFEMKLPQKDSAIAPEFAVLCAEKPQLAVVQGLVFNRAQELFKGASVFDQVCCRESYGIVTQQLYNKKEHRGEIPNRGTDGKQWVFGQIDWVVEQGVLLPSSGLTKTYNWAFDDGEEKIPWTCEIVSCTFPRAHLPSSTSHKGVKQVCSIEVDISELTKRKKRKSWLVRPSKVQTYNVVSFDLRIVVGAADLGFQLHPRGESDTLISQAHKKIKVEWVPTEAAADVKLPDIGSKQQPFLSGKKPRKLIG